MMGGRLARCCIETPCKVFPSLRQAWRYRVGACDCAKKVQSEP